MRPPIRRPVVATLMLLALPALAQGVHEHGAARLDAVLEGNRIELLLTLPAMDAVGFERAAANDAEREAIEAARRRLLDHAQLWRFTPSAGCVARAPMLHVDAAGDAGDAHHDHDHVPGHAHHDWQARYRFECARPDQLRRIVTGLFAGFPRLQRVDLQWIGPAGATAQALSPARAWIEVAP